MLAGRLQTKNGKWYAVLNCRHHDGRRFPKRVSTDIPDKKGSKRAAKETLNYFCTLFLVACTPTTFFHFGQRRCRKHPPPLSAKPSLSLFTISAKKKKTGRIDSMWSVFVAIFDWLNFCGYTFILFRLLTLLTAPAAPGKTLAGRTGFSRNTDRDGLWGRFYMPVAIPARRCAGSLR